MERKDLKFMHLALEEAKKAASIAEVPVGAVIVKDDQVIASAHNLRETQQQPCAHAEILVLQKAAEVLGQWRLIDCDLYVTLEPCMMCFGAISLARIRAVYYGATDFKAGVCGGKLDLKKVESLNHWPEVYPGLLAEESAALLSDFFKKLREEKIARLLS